MCNPWNHRDPSDCSRFWCFELLAGGARDRASLALTKTLALVCEINPRRRIDVPAERETYVKHKLSTSLFPSVKGYCSGDELDCFLFGVAGHLKPWDLGWMDLLFLLGFLTCTLRNWNPRPACGTAFSSVHNILSVRHGREYSQKGTYIIDYHRISLTTSPRLSMVS